MTVPSPTGDDPAPVPEDTEFDESFWRGYAIDVAGYREKRVDRLLADGGVRALVDELGTKRDD